jgi:hypothetical protein
MLSGKLLCKVTIRNFNQIFRYFDMKILEINFGHTGSNSKKVALLKKAMKMQGTLVVCTVEAGQCIQ